MNPPRICLLAALALAGCISAKAPVPPVMLTRHAAEKRAALDLHSASLASNQLGTEEGRRLYDHAVADLTVVLRTAEGGALWNRPLKLTTGNESYHLQFATGAGKGYWNLNTFTSFVPAEKVSLKSIRHRNFQAGVGGALVGVRKERPREPFTFRWGVTGPVTATLNFHGHDATLALYNPEKQTTAMVAGAMRPLEADFSAPLAYYPSVNELLAGFLAAIQVKDYIAKTGLYTLEPDDPDRIPVIFVHGLISTPQMWRNVINELKFDPELRAHCQCWVFGYPSGMPISYSAMRFRQELAKGRQRYGWRHGIVLVGHSMGGLISQMQAVTLTHEDWIRVIGKPAQDTLARASPDKTIHQMLMWNANPDIKRIIFICTPHRGTDMATGLIGRIGMRLITLPLTLASTLKNAVARGLGFEAGDARMVPNGVTSLSPKNATLKVLDTLPIRAPYNSIIGDRGRGDTPNSSDGVVPYRSAHLDGAQSEKIVPGLHASCELPQTIAEIRRILILHLKAGAKN